jgi:DnaJ like chaperone protein
MFIDLSGAAYRILEIEPTATNDEVKSAYRTMAKKYHPDKVSHLGEEIQKTANEKFKKVNEAYEKIKNERGMP